MASWPVQPDEPHDWATPPASASPPRTVTTSSGVVHIESDQDIPHTLGQLFTEWSQPLTTSQVGPVHAQAGEQVRVYRNGTPVSGDPAALKFGASDEIVVWLGSHRPATPHPQQLHLPQRPVEPAAIGRIRAWPLNTRLSHVRGRPAPDGRLP
jgi:hypothetical protein